MTQHLHQFVRDIPRPKATSEYYWKRVQLIGFMCYCKKCNHRVDKAGIIPKKCPNCGDGLKEIKIEYKMKCKYCGDIQIIKKKRFEDILENGCDDECWECMKRGYEPVISEEEPFVLDYETFEKAARGHPLLEVIDEEPKDNSLPPCCDCPRDESSCESERLTCTTQKHYKNPEEPPINLTKHFDSLDIEPPEEPGKDGVQICSRCGGSGRSFEGRCSRCDGTGAVFLITSTEEFEKERKVE